MVLILTSGNDSGEIVAKGLEKLNLHTVCCDEKSDIGDISQYEAMFFTGDFAIGSVDCAAFAKKLCVEFSAAEIPAIFDPTLSSLQPESYDMINEFASLCSIFVPSDEDAKALCGLSDPEKTAEHYLKRGTPKIVITLDKKGAFFKSAKEFGHTPTFRANKVINTKGAGNAFAAGLISGVTENLPLAEAVVRANACGSIYIQHDGGYFPDPSELRDFMLSNRFAVEGCKEF